MVRSLIKIHTSSVVKALIEQANTLSELDHALLKGELREIFISNIIKKFLTSQFDVGSGVIINKEGEQSTQTDVIIYDTRILPPFIKEYNLGVYPEESVLATIEVKSWFSKNDIIESSNVAQYLLNNIYRGKKNWGSFRDMNIAKPLCCIVGFFDNCHFDYDNKEEIKKWIEQHNKSLFGICLINKFSWLDIYVEGIRGDLILTDEYNEETKAFIAVLLDYISKFSQERLARRGTTLVEWFSAYIRDFP